MTSLRFTFLYAWHLASSVYDLVLSLSISSYFVQVYNTLAAAQQASSDILPPAAKSCLSQMFRARRRDMPALPAAIRDIDLGQVCRQNATK